MSKIEWTDKTWNPTTGCNKVSTGCKNCYAERQHKRMMHMHPQKYTNEFSKGVQCHEDVLGQPIRWKKPQRIFVNSMSDLFHEDVPFEFIENVFQVMAKCSQHTFQILTKRPENMLRTLNEMIWSNSDNILPNVWLGVSCENQQAADERIPYLLQTPAAIRFLSCEPLLGPIVLDENWLDTAVYRIRWVIAGGESGPDARPMHPDWARSLRDQCKAAGVPFFFKQWGEWIAGDQRNLEFLDFESVQCKTWPEGNKWSYKIGKKASGHLLDGVEHFEFPQQFKKLQPA